MSSSSVRVSLPGELDPETFPDFLHDMLSVIYERNIIASMTGRQRKGSYNKTGPNELKAPNEKSDVMHKYNQTVTEHRSLKCPSKVLLRYNTNNKIYLFSQTLNFWDKWLF